jgi:hypothetical protein
MMDAAIQEKAAEDETAEQKRSFHRTDLHAGWLLRFLGAYLCCLACEAATLHLLKWGCWVDCCPRPKTLERMKPAVRAAGLLSILISYWSCRLRAMRW